MVQRETFVVVTSMNEDGTVSQHLRAVITYYPDEHPPATPAQAPPLLAWQPSYIDADGVPVLTFD